MGGEDVVQIVRHPGGQGADGLHPLRVQELLLQLLALGEVRGDAHDPVDRTAGRADGKGAVANPTHRAVGPGDAIFHVVRPRRPSGRGRLLDPRAVVRDDRPAPGPRLPPELRARPSPDALEGGADVDHLVVPRIRHPEDLADVLGHLPKPLLAGPEGLRRFPPRGDVARDLRGPDDPPRGVADRRNGRGDVDQAPVPAPAHGLVMLHGLAAADARDDFGFLVGAVGRDELRDIPADDLARGIAKDPFGAPVPADNGAVEPLADDGVVRGLDDRGQLLARLPQLAALPPAAGLDPVRRPRRDPDQRAKSEEIGNRQQPQAPLRAVPTRTLSPQPQPAEDEREHDRRRQQAAAGRAAGGVPQDQSHRQLAGPRQQGPQPQGKQGQAAMRRHAPREQQRPSAVEDAAESQEADQRHSERAAGCHRAPFPRWEKGQRQPQE